MRQVLQLFRKDCRKFWPEALLCAIMSGLVCWAIPHKWVDSEAASTGPLDLHKIKQLEPVIFVGLILGWFLLIQRVVQAESLVGTRQYWVSRPIRWTALLAEKLLFVGVFTLTPIEVAQLVLLHRAGFSPEHYVMGLLYNLGMVIGVILVPMFVLATVTPSLVRSLGIIMVLTVSIAGIAFLATSSPDTSISIPYTDRISFPLAMVFSIAVIVSQYAARRLWFSRMLCVVGMLTIALVASNPLEKSMLERAYPVTPNTPISLKGAQDDAALLKASNEDERAVRLSLGMTATDVASGYMLSPEDARITFTPAGGAPVELSGWQATNNIHLSDRFPHQSVGVLIARKVYERVAGKEGSLSLELAVAKEASGRELIFGMPLDHEVDIPDFGKCKIRESEFSGDELFCLTPLREPYFARVKMNGANKPCAESSGDEHNGFFQWVWTGERERDAADFSLTPVDTHEISFPSTSETRFGNSKSFVLHPCSDSRLSVVPYTVASRFRTRIDLPRVEMPKTK